MGVATAIVLGGDVSLSRAATVDLTVISAADVAATVGPVVAGVLCFLLLSRKRRTWLWSALRYRCKQIPPYKPPDGNAHILSR